MENVRDELCNTFALQSSVVVQIVKFSQKSEAQQLNFHRAFITIANFLLPFGTDSKKNKNKTKRRAGKNRGFVD